MTETISSLDEEEQEEDEGTMVPALIHKKTTRQSPSGIVLEHEELIIQAENLVDCKKLFKELWGC